VARPAAPIVRRPSYGAPFLHGPVIGRRPFVSYSPFVSLAPIYALPIWEVPIDPLPFDQARWYYSNPASPAQNNDQAELADRVDRLTQEIGRLQEELASREVRETPIGARESPETPSTPTLLIFRDGHRVEIQSYVIAGQTLWIVDETTAAKIPLSDLDLAATRRENLQRGINFLIPSPNKN